MSPTHHRHRGIRPIAGDGRGEARSRTPQGRARAAADFAGYRAAQEEPQSNQCDTVSATTECHAPLPASFKMDRDRLVVKRVPWLVDFQKLGLMCVVLLICIT